MMEKRDHNRLVEIQSEMLDLYHEAKELLRRCGGTTAVARAKAYWMASVEMGLTNDHNYLGSAGVSMEDTIRETDPGDEEEEVCELCGEPSCLGCEEEGEEDTAGLRTLDSDPCADDEGRWEVENRVMRAMDLIEEIGKHFNPTEEVYVLERNGREAKVVGVGSIGGQPVVFLEDPLSKTSDVDVGDEPSYPGP